MQSGAFKGGVEQHGVQLVVVLDVQLLLALLHLVQRRLRDVDVAALDQVGKLPVEERQQQSAYVAPVNISIGHENHAVIAQLGDVEVVAADATAQRGDERADFGGRQHFVEACPLDIQDLALERQDRLSPPVAALFGRTAGGIALHNEEL